MLSVNYKLQEAVKNLEQQAYKDILNIDHTQDNVGYAFAYAKGRARALESVRTIIEALNKDALPL